MEILLLNDTYYPIVDGVGMVVENYARYLTKQGVGTAVVTAHVPGVEDSDEFPVYRYSSMKIPRRPPYRIGVPLLEIPLMQKLARKNFDLLHSHCPFATGALATAMSARRKVPHITTFHSKYKEDFHRVLKQKSLVEMALKLSLEHYKKADYVWVPNEPTGETLRSYGYKGSYEVWPNGTDMQVPNQELYDSFRKEGKLLAGVPENVFTMLFVGQHIWEKNIRLILDALIILSKKGIPFHMIFAGNGYAYEEIKDTIVKNGLSRNVTLMGSVSDRKVLQALYAASDVFVFPSLYDNAPLVIREAAAFGVPPIVAKGSNSARDILDGVSGFHIQNDVDRLVSMIETLENDKNLLQKAGANARENVYLHWENIVKRVLVRYQEIITDYRGKK